MKRTPDKAKTPKAATAREKHSDMLDLILRALERLEVARYSDDQWWRSLTPWQRLKAMVRDIVTGSRRDDGIVIGYDEE